MSHFGGTGAITINDITNSVTVGDTVGGGTAGSVPFIDATPALAQDNTNLFWDSTIKQLKVGMAQVTKAYTVAAGANTLPTPAVGMIARVTDANNPTIGSTVASGGAAAALVWYNGANWTVIGK